MRLSTPGRRAGGPAGPLPRALAILLLLLPATVARGADAPAAASIDAAELARTVTIYRDEWGVPHIYGPTDRSVIFGFAWAQAEDGFWQVEDNFIMALGRYAEVHGEKELGRDLRNRAFEVARRARADYRRASPQARLVAEAFTAGLNYYLERHPEVKPRLIERFEPWHVLAYSRMLTLEFCFGSAHVSSKMLREGTIWERRGSNAWAIAPSRTRSGHAMLLINPHQPWYGIGQFYEVHLTSGEGWSFSGATFYGSPIPSLGHNGHAGWAMTVNEPDVADAWVETFDDPGDPLAYRYGDGHRRAEEWTETIRVRNLLGGIDARTHTFRKTHHGPIVSRKNASEYIAVRIAGFDTSFGAEQALALLRVRGLDDFKKAMGLLQFPIFNVVYADRRGDTYYLYNGVVPRRREGIDWTRPVDGADPRNEWQGIHLLEELPQMENPPSGFLQSCNSSPFLTSDDGNPFRGDYPAYMGEDFGVDKRRAKLSRMLLRRTRGLTLDGLRELAFDTTVYWALVELPRLSRAFERLAARRPEIAAEARPFFEHLRGWSCRIEPDSTEASLCAAWYEELYGTRYPAETLLERYRRDPDLRFEALVKAARKLESFHGTWKVPYGEIHRLQRHAQVADFFKIPFDDRLPSLPCAGAPGPLGIVFTVYYTPSVVVPFLKRMRRRYAIVGSSYMAVIEFGERIRARSLLSYGESANADSPHFFDQAELFSKRQMKPQYFYRDEVLAHAVSAYHPGGEPGPLRAAPARAGSGAAGDGAQR